MRAIQYLIVSASWLGFAAALAVNHVRVRRRRGRESPQSQQRALRAPASMLGLLLEGLALTIAITWRSPAPATAAIAWAAAAISAASSAFSAAALKHLGDQWRVKAVVTEDHKLIQSGPYALVRHPIYLALGGLILATALLLSDWRGMVVAMALFLVGTEIRIRAEESLLRRRFGLEFERYRYRTKALIPFVR